RIEHAAFDFLREKVFAGHPLCWPVLGYENTIRPLTREAMLAYFQRRYAPQNLVLIVAGNVDPNQTIEIAERHCGSWRATGPAAPSIRTRPTIHAGTGVKNLDRFQQQIIALNFAAAGALDPMYETANAAAAILGADNSRMFWNIVQEGLSPRAGAYHMDYAD